MQSIFTVITDTPSPQAHSLLFPDESERLYEVSPATRAQSQPGQTC